MAGTFDGCQTDRFVVGAETVVEGHAQKEGVLGSRNVGKRRRDLPCVGEVFRGDIRAGQSVVVILFAVKTDAADMFVT
jgi:hypothetical protein